MIEYQLTMANTLVNRIIGQANNLGRSVRSVDTNYQSDEAAFETLSNIYTSLSTLKVLLQRQFTTAHRYHHNPRLVLDDWNQLYEESDSAFVFLRAPAVPLTQSTADDRSRLAWLTLKLCKLKLAKFLRDLRGWFEHTSIVCK